MGRWERVRMCSVGLHGCQLADSCGGKQVSPNFLTESKGRFDLNVMISFKDASNLYGCC